MDMEMLFVTVSLPYKFTSGFCVHFIKDKIDLNIILLCLLKFSVKFVFFSSSFSSWVSQSNFQLNWCARSIDIFNARHSVYVLSLQCLSLAHSLWNRLSCLSCARYHCTIHWKRQMSLKLKIDNSVVVVVVEMRALSILPYFH